MWFKVDDKLPMNPKAMQCSLSAIGLWTLAGAWSAQQLTDGYVPKQVLQALRGSASFASELVDAGLWEETPDGYQFHDWADFQFTASEVKATREKRAESGRKGGQASGRSRREANASSKTKQTRSKNEPHPIPSHPLLKETTNVVSSSGKKPETRLPDGWMPTKEHAQRARESGLDLMEQADYFRAHAETHDRHAANWNSAFTTWLKKASEFTQRDRQREAAGNLTRSQRAAMSDLQRQLAQEQAQRNQASMLAIEGGAA